jgi:hypothetical protein
VRRRVNRRDPEGRGAAWLADYDATSPDVLAPAPASVMRDHAERRPGQAGSLRSDRARR